MMMALWVWEEQAVIKQLSAKLAAPAGRRAAPRWRHRVADQDAGPKPRAQPAPVFLDGQGRRRVPPRSRVRARAQLGRPGADAVVATFYRVMEKTELVRSVPGGHFLTLWYHPVQGYDVGYYGYGCDRPRVWCCQRCPSLALAFRSPFRACAARAHTHYTCILP